MPDFQVASEEQERQLRKLMEDRERQVIEELLEATQRDTSINELKEAIKGAKELLREPEALKMPTSQRKKLQGLIDKQGRPWRQQQEGINVMPDKGSSNQDMTGPHKVPAPQPHQHPGPTKTQVPPNP